MRDLLEIQASLHAYRDFSECVLRSIEWRNHATSVVLTIDYPWTPSGIIRSDHAERLLVDLDFALVQEFSVKNQLPPDCVRDPSLISWGLTEISIVRIRDDDLSEQYRTPDTAFHHMTVRREGSDWIEIVFADLSVSERTEPANGR